MCRNIKTLYNFAPPATDEEIRAASLQYVRKVTGFNKPSKTNEAAFHAEYQNQPLPEVTVDSELLTADEIMAKINGRERGNVPIGCHHIRVWGRRIGDGRAIGRAPVHMPDRGLGLRGTVRDRRVNRVAPLLQNAQASGRSQRLAGRDHPVHRADGRSRLAARRSRFVANLILRIDWKHR